MHENKVVVHTREGRIIKGLTQDFDLRQGVLYVLPGEGGGIPVRCALEEIKGVFFVKDYVGNREYDPPSGFGSGPDRGRRCIVTFQDGEIIFGTTPDYEDLHQGFTLYPSDPDDNNVRIFVSRAAVRAIEFSKDEP